MIALGTIINIVTVLIGGSFGLLVGERLTDELERIVMNGLGLITLVIGISMALQTTNIFIPMGSVLIGGLLGQWWGIDEKLDHLGDRLKEKSSQSFAFIGEQGKFTEGFVTASLVFCVGPMTVLGAIQDGLTGDFELLAIKAGLDGFAAMTFASTLGAGVLFSVLTLLFYQGGITVLAVVLRSQFVGVNVENSLAVGELSATGGILIIGIGLLLLEVTDVKVSNYLPAIALAPAIVMILSLF